MTENDVTISHDRAGRRIIRARDDDGVDVMRSQQGSHSPKRRIGTAGNDACVHGSSDCGFRLGLRRRHDSIVNPGAGAGEVLPDVDVEYGLQAVNDSDLERYILTARLKPGEAAEAERTLAEGPPFDPAEAGLAGHSAYLTSDSVYLVFEGRVARVKALQLARQHMADVSYWQRIVSDLPSRVDEVPSDARCLYRWTPESST
jgi:hypothetical protein